MSKNRLTLNNTIPPLFHVIIATYFENLASAKLKSIFLVLQKVHEQIIIHYGGNNFKVPHLRNDRVLLENDDTYSTGMQATKIIDNFLHDNIQEDFDLLHEQVVESEIEDGSDIELDDLLVRIENLIKKINVT